MSGARLEIEGLGKRFRGLRAVHDVSFSVPAGEATELLTYEHDIDLAQEVSDL